MTVASVGTEGEEDEEATSAEPELVDRKRGEEDEE
jgi:hypothetical protein